MILSGCINAREKGRPEYSPTVKASTEPDTIVHSFPIYYMKALDTVNASRIVKISSYKDILERDHCPI
jgi:hypothetical protein